MTTIKLSDPKDHTADSPTATRLHTGEYRSTASPEVSHDDGVYNIRSNIRRLSARGGDDAEKSVSSDDEDAGLHKPVDFKQKQVFSGKMLLWLAYQSMGVIYGDIGTSPLYVYSATFSSAPSHQDLVGVLSIIIWSLFMMVTVKYVFIVLRADNNGEGGTFSTYSLLSRYMNISHRDPREAATIEIKRHLSGDLQHVSRRMRHGVESSKFARGLLKIIGLLSVTMIISDGILTPAQSVLGAVQGIQVVSPGISRGTVVGATDAILLVIFLVQPFGITKITVAFSPIVLLWLGFNAVFGVYNLANYDAGVMRAFNPGYAFDFLVRNKEPGWRMLGGVLLTFTGLEALFADLGAFSRRAVQLSWLCYTFPCLLLAYIGQAAYISHFPEAYSNPFFNAAPPGTIYPALIIAVLAAIVASQAIITATFQLISCLIKLSYFPQLKVVHTSKLFHGQQYIPIANWLLMIGTILVATLYKNTTALGQAYGVCVMFVTFFDTCMVSMVAIFIWRLPPWVVFLPWLIISCLDGTFLSSALTKVPNGAWFTITLAIVLALILLLWRFGKEQQWAVESNDRFTVSHFVRAYPNGQVRLTESYGSDQVTTIQGFGIFFNKIGDYSPLVFSQFVQKLKAVREVTVFFHLRPLEIPSVEPEDRFTVSRLSLPNCYRLIVRYGFTDEILSKDLAGMACEHIGRYLIRKSQIDLDGRESKENMQQSQDSYGEQHDAKSASASNNRQVDQVQTPISKEVTTLQNAYAHRVHYILGKEELKIKSLQGFKPAKAIRMLLLTIFLYMRDDTRGRMANMNVPTDKVIEIGFLKEV